MTATITSASDTRASTNARREGLLAAHLEAVVGAIDAAVHLGRYRTEVPLLADEGLQQDVDSRLREAGYGVTLLYSREDGCARPDRIEIDWSRPLEQASRALARRGE